MNRLRTDARIRLETSDGWTRLVLLLSIDKDHQKLIFERWERRVQDPNAMTTRSNRLFIQSRCVQRVTVDFANGNVVTNAPLILPIKLMFDNPVCLPPNPLPIDTIISVSTTDIQGLAELLFGWQGFTVLSSTAIWAAVPII